MVLYVCHMVTLFVQVQPFHIVPACSSPHMPVFVAVFMCLTLSLAGCVGVLMCLSLSAGVPMCLCLQVCLLVFLCVYRLSVFVFMDLANVE